MARFGFVGGSYQSESPYSDAESTMNWYPETMESQGAKSAMTLYPTPGLSAFGAGLGNPIGQLLSVNGRLFGVETQSGAANFYEFNSSGTIARSFSMAAGATSLVAGNFYVFAVGNGHAYAFKLANNTFTEVTSSLAQSNPTLGFFIDGYYGVIFGNSNEFQISSLEDPTTWNGVDVAQVSVFPENLVGCLVDHRVLWLWGSQHAQAYYNSGDPTFPLNVIPGGFIEQGLDSPTCPVRMDNSVFWIGSDERGAGIAWRANGYTPVRVSNHAIENKWKSYPAGVTDSIGWTYQDKGHTFWVLYFPSGNATWVYDAATNLWHQRGHWNGTSQDAHWGISHAYCFGQHLIGSRASTNIYSMSTGYNDDAGTTIVRERVAPIVSTELEYMFHRQVTVDVQPNTANAGDNNANISIYWSDDGGTTWVGPKTVFAGNATSTVQRCVLRRLGRSRQRIYKINVSDSIPWRIMDAYLLADPGFQHVPRLSKYFGQMQ